MSHENKRADARDAGPPASKAFPVAIASYRITELIGRGGFSCVYRGQSTKTGKTVAIKVGAAAGGGKWLDRLTEVSSVCHLNAISPDEYPADAFLYRDDILQSDLINTNEIDELLQREAKVLRRVNSPNVVKLHEVAKCENGRPALILDYIEGQTIRQMIRERKGIRVNWFLKLVRELKRLRNNKTMAFHGDIKPENIIVGNDGNKVILIDPSPGDGDTVMPMTPMFNPLLLQSSIADVMGIGALLYEVTTGTDAFDGKTWEYAGMKVQGEVMRLSRSFFLSHLSPTEVDKKISPELARIIEHCLCADSRYDLPQLEEELVAFLETP